MNDESKTAAPALGNGLERRKHRRKKCLLPAQLITNLGAHDCRVLDLSQGGAKVETSAIVTADQAVTLVVKPIGTFTGLVAWRADGCLGMKFLTQYGTTISRTASLGASFRAESESRPAAAVPAVTSKKVTVPDAVAAADGKAQARKARASVSRSAFVLDDGDMICLLRKKSDEPGSHSNSSQQARARRGRIVGRKLTDFTLLEVGAREFLELAQQQSGYTVTFVRVSRAPNSHRDIDGELKSIKADDGITLVPIAKP